MATYMDGDGKYQDFEKTVIELLNGILEALQSNSSDTTEETPAETTPETTPDTPGDNTGDPPGDGDDDPPASEETGT